MGGVKEEEVDRRTHSSALDLESCPERGKLNSIFWVARRKEAKGMEGCFVQFGSWSKARREGLQGAGGGVRVQVVG